MDNRAKGLLGDAEDLINQVRDKIGDSELLIATRESVARTKQRLAKLGLDERCNELAEQVVEVLGKPHPTAGDYQQAVQLLVLRFLMTGERKISDIGMGIKQIMDVMGSSSKPKDDEFDGGGIDTEV